MNAMTPGCRITQYASFVRDRRAAATAVTAAIFTLMSLAGIALAGDHSYLVYQRDLLKAAVDAATIATTRYMSSLASSLSDAQVNAALEPVARRYILANIPESKRERVAETLTLTVEPNRAVGTVKVEAEADLGGAVFGRWLWGRVVDRTLEKSGVERVGGVTEVALAIDMTSSMRKNLSGGTNGKSRIAIVKGVAQDLVDTLTGSGGDVAVGLVPWSFNVRLDQQTRQRWEDHAWVQYPTRRFYPYPYLGSTTGEEQASLPTKSEVWLGCVDQRDMSGDTPLGVSAVPPTSDPFTMGFYTPTTMWINARGQSIAFECRDDQEHCYSDSSLPGQGRSPQHFCGLISSAEYITPLTTDADTIRARIDALRAFSGNGTYSTLGVVWGHRLLAPAWRNIWGDAKHPVDPDYHPGTQKALVLLTDGKDEHIRIRGEDNPDEALMREHLQKACTAAKNAGIKVFTIAALPASGDNWAQFKDDLEQCSSQADDPDGQYAFVSNATPEALQGAFSQIATQLVQLRRIL